MPEGPTPGPSRRGRRSPELAAQIEARPLDDDADLLRETDEAEPIVAYADGPLDPGDTLAVKVVHEVDFGGSSSWFTLGTQTTVRIGETAEEAFQRVVTLVNDGVLDVIADAEERIGEMRELVNRQTRARRVRGQ